MLCAALICSVRAIFLCLKHPAVAFNTRELPTHWQTRQALHVACVSGCVRPVLVQLQLGKGVFAAGSCRSLA